MQLSSLFIPMADSHLPNMGLLSRSAAYLRRALPRHSHLSGITVYPQSFTVRDLRIALQTRITADILTDDEDALRIFTTAIISSLESQCFFYVVDWKEIASAADDDVCMFLYYEEDEQPPTGVFPELTKCYSPTCEEAGPCYSPSCPRRMRPRQTGSIKEHPPPHIISKCYSPTCEPGVGCYSPTCPHRNSNIGSLRRSSQESISSNGPPSPVDVTCAIGMDKESSACFERPRHSLSSYLMDFPTEDFLTDFWICTSGFRRDQNNTGNNTCSYKFFEKVQDSLASACSFVSPTGDDENLSVDACLGDEAAYMRRRRDSKRTSGRERQARNYEVLLVGIRFP